MMKQTDLSSDFFLHLQQILVYAMLAGLGTRQAGMRLPPLSRIVQMKFLYAATGLSILLCAAAPSYAADLSGNYEASFSVANGMQQPVCFQLASAGPKQNFKETGTVTSPTYPGYSGSYVVYKRSFHLTFLNSDAPLITITGFISQGHLIYTSATKFKSTGEITNVGNFTEAKGCS